MPPALTAPRRSPALARTLLLGACALGLAGLAGPGHAGAPSSSTAQLSAASMSAVSSSTVEVEPLAPHTLPVPTPAKATVSAKRASRTRTVAPKKKSTTGRWVRPSSSGVNSAYGMRWGRMHKGIDFGARTGAPIYAVADGVVVAMGYPSGESGYGLITIIRHGNGFYSAYAHQSSTLVRVGEHVTAGEVIGRVGSTGHVTGPHLHFEIRTSTHGGQVNPVTFLRAHGLSL